MWMNHHNMFNYIRRIDRRFMFLNGLLLLFVTLTPFTTSLVAEHLLYSDSRTAGAVYSRIPSARISLERSLASRLKQP